MAGAILPPFISSISSPLLAVAPVGMWAKASISPLSVFAREAGKRSRSAKPIVHISTGLPRRPAAACGRRGSDAAVLRCKNAARHRSRPSPRRRWHRRASRPPGILGCATAARQRYCAAALATHVDRDAALFEDAGELRAGELAALVRVEDFGLAVLCQGCQFTSTQFTGVLEQG